MVDHRRMAFEQRYVDQPRVLMSRRQRGHVDLQSEQHLTAHNAFAQPCRRTCVRNSNHGHELLLHWKCGQPRPFFHRSKNHHGNMGGAYRFGRDHRSGFLDRRGELEHVFNCIWRSYLPARATRTRSPFARKFSVEVDPDHRFDRRGHWFLDGRGGDGLRPSRTC